MKVGFVRLGTMCGPTAGRLLAGGDDVAACDIKAGPDDLVAGGGGALGSAKLVFRAA